MTIHNVSSKCSLIFIQSIAPYNIWYCIVANSVIEDPLPKTVQILKLNKLYLFLSYVLKIVNSMNLEFISVRATKVTSINAQNFSISYKQILGNYIKSTYIVTTSLRLINPNNPSYFLPLKEIYSSVNV